jgi:ribosome-associated protein
MGTGTRAGTPRRGVVLDAERVIPESELVIRASRSGGPGGQNVNKVATRIELRFDLAGSSVFDADEKSRLRRRLGARVNTAGILRIVSQKHRSRSRNEAEARVRLAELLRAALVVPPRRRRTTASISARESRLREKKHRGERKRERGSVRRSD